MDLRGMTMLRYSTFFRIEALQSYAVYFLIQDIPLFRGWFSLFVGDTTKAFKNTLNGLYSN